MKQLFTLLVAVVLAFPTAVWATTGVSATAARFADQGTRVAGVVQDAEGSPIVGATVKAVSRTTRQLISGTYTDANGQFALTLSSTENVEIQVSFVGYRTAYADAGENLSLVLEADYIDISETVITAQGLAVDRDKIGYSTSQVNGSNVVRSGETSLLTGLSGKAAGLNITRSTGDPGAGAYILLRGQSTIFGETQPLIVVDGVPINNSTLGSGVDGVVQQSRLNDINPNDIESIEIIKGGAGAAIWGSRGNAGVIVITTKKGKSSLGRVDVNVTTRLSIDEVNVLPDLQSRFGGGNGGLYQFNPVGGRSWGDPIFLRPGGADAVINPGAYLVLPDGSRRYAVVGGTAGDPSGGKNSTQTYDNVDDIFRTGYFWENNFSVSTATDRSSIFFSLGYLDQRGVIKNNSDYQRYTAGLRASHRITDNFTVSMSANYSYNDSKRIQQGSNLSGIFLGGLRTSPDFDNTVYLGTYVDAGGTEFANRHVSYRNPIGAGNAVYDNPNFTINENQSTTRVNRIFGNLELTWQPTSWLTVIERFGLDSYTDERDDYFDAQSRALPGGGYTAQTVGETQLNNDLIVSAAKTFNSFFSVSGLVGFNLNHERFRNAGGSVTQFVLPDAPPSLTNSLPENRTTFNSLSFIRRSALYGQLDLGFWEDQVLLSATGRIENNTNFGPDADATYFYPSVSAIWQFSKLGVFEGLEWLNFGKLRASVSRVGVQPSANYLYTTSFGPSSIGEGWGGVIDGSQYGVGGYARSTVAANTALTPEQKDEFELGLDLRLFDERLSFTANYYTNLITDIIIPGAPVAPSVGFSSSTLNAGTMRNVGVEFEGAYNWFRKGDWSITTSFNWSHNENQVLEITSGSVLGLAGFTEPASSAVVGHSLGVIYGLDFSRDANNNPVLDAFGFPDGNLLVEKVLGDPNPDWRAGIGNEIRYKGFSVYALFEIVEGYQIWNGTRGALTFFGKSDNTDLWTTVDENTTALDYFDNSLADLVAQGNAVDNGNGTISFRGTIQDFGGGPVIVNEYWYRSGPGSGFTGPSSQFMEQGDHIRLRELTLRYNWRSEWLTRTTKIKSIDIGVTGRNLALWTDFTGIDPETNLTGPSNGRGLEYFNNPNTRSYIFTLSINY